jgi:hypothetical protein
MARVHDHYLYRSAVAGVGSGATRPEDSLLAVQQYVDSWIRQQLILHYAEQNLADDEKNLDEQLRSYKESLLIHLYEKKLVEEKLDTAISDSEIMKYYEENKGTFELKKSIVQMRFIMLPSTFPSSLDSVKKWLKEPNDFNRPKLEGFCRENTVHYSLSDSSWYNKEETASLLAGAGIDLDNAMFSRSFLVAPADQYVFFIQFGDYRIKGDEAPVEFIRPRIKNILLNKRKQEFISQIHQGIYEKALNEKDFEVF